MADNELPPGPIGSPWVSRIAVHGVKYLPNLDIPMGTVLEVCGENGTGKSVLLKLIARSVKKEHDPELIGDDYDEATVTLEFIDSTDVTFSVKTITTRTKTTREISASDGRVIDDKVETWLAQLTNVYLIDPLALLDADKKKREAYLKKALPVTFTAAELTAVLGQPTPDCDLTAFAGLLAGAEDNRTKLNKIASDTDGAINRIAPSVLENVSDVNYSTEAHLCAQRKRAAEDTLTDLAHKRELLGNQQLSDRQKKLDADIAELRRVAELDKSALRDQIKLDIAALQKTHQPIIAALQEEYGTLNAKATEQVRQKALRDELDKLKKDLVTQRRSATAAQRIVDKLTDLRSAKWKDLPLKGVEYRDGEIFVNGKNLDDQVNTAAIYTTLLKIATFSYRPGMLPLIITHRTESLSKKTREWFYAAVKDAGYQLCCERVVDRPDNGEDDTDPYFFVDVLDDPKAPPVWTSQDSPHQAQPLKLERIK